MQLKQVCKKPRLSQVSHFSPCPLVPGTKWSRPGGLGDPWSAQLWSAASASSPPSGMRPSAAKSNKYLDAEYKCLFDLGSRFQTPMCIYSWDRMTGIGWRDLSQAQRPITRLVIGGFILTVDQKTLHGCASEAFGREWLFFISESSMTNLPEEVDG